MNRRDSVIGLAVLGALPLAAVTSAQPIAKPARIAFLGFASAETAGHSMDAFKQRLRELGYVEGRNIVFDVRWALGDIDRLPDLAKEIVAQQPDVIVTASSRTTIAVRQATSTIPIVITNVSDPVGAGHVRSLSRPGGNVTGLSTLAVDVSSKYLELLLAVAPEQSAVAVLVGPSLTPTLRTNIENAARLMKVKLRIIRADTRGDIENAFADIVRENIRALIVLADAQFLLQRRHIAESAIKNRISTIFAAREYAEAGGLMSYGTDSNDSYRGAADYVDRILKGAKPGDLPVEQSRKFEYVINLKTAKALGVAIPQALLLRADRVIE